MSKVQLTGASQVQGVLPVTDGGSGTNTLTGVLKGNGTSAFSAATAGTDFVAPGGALGTPSSGTATNLTGFPTLNQSTTGNAATATALATARTINGVSFNGTGNIVITKRQVSPSSSATPSVNIDTTDIVTIAVTANITSMSSGLSGTPYHGQPIMWEFTGSSAFTIVWGASFGSSGVATLLATTVASKVHRVFTVYDSSKSLHVCMAVDATGY
jgi:hypothetical protein